MTRARVFVCAGVLLALVLAGCKGGDLTSLFLLESTTAGRERLVVGSLESVSASTQAALRQLDVKAVATEEAGVVRIAGTTRSDARFKIILTRADGDGTRQTRVKIEWEGSPDDQFGFQLLSHLGTASRR